MKKTSCIVFLPAWAQSIVTAALRNMSTPVGRRASPGWQIRTEPIHSRKGLDGIAVHCPREAMLAFVGAVKRHATPFVVKSEGAAPSEAPLIVGRIVEGSYRVTAVATDSKPRRKGMPSLRERFFAQRRVEASRVTANQIFAQSCEASRNIAGSARRLFSA